MKPHLTLAETRTKNGARLSLHAHDGSFAIRVDGKDLMHSSTTASEVLLGELATARLSTKTFPRILVGGLGLGFTLKSVLQHAGNSAVVEVAELMPEVVEWNRTFLSGLNGRLLQDPRVRILVKDLGSVLAQARPNGYDAIVLDLDNGPTAMVQASNARVYEAVGLERLAFALKPGGRAAIWSAAPDRAFAARLVKAGFKVEAVPAKLHATAKRSAYLIYVADKAAETAAAVRG